MSKYQVILNKMIVGYDDVEDKWILYKPIEVKLKNVPAQAVSGIIACVKQHPEGGSLRIEE